MLNPSNESFTLPANLVNEAFSTDNNTPKNSRLDA